MIPETVAANRRETFTPAARSWRRTQLTTGTAVALWPATILSLDAARQNFGFGAPTPVLVGLAAVAVILLVIGWVGAPAERDTKRRALIFLAAALVAGVVILPSISYSVSFRFALLAFGFVPVGLGLSGWLVLRHRGGAAFVALLFSILASAAAFSPSVVVLWIVLIIAPVAGAWVGAALGRNNGSSDRNSAALQAQRIETNAQAIREWQAAYILANPGQPVPMLPPTYVVTPQSDRTNTFAVLALVFGLLGGYLGIVFGFIAKSQIKRTGEQGNQLATVGLVLGWIWFASTITYWVVFFVLISI